MQGQLISESQKLDFLEFIRQGFTRPEAARKVSENLTGSSFRKLCNPKSIHYDSRFHSCYDQAMEIGGEHEQNKRERLEEAAFRRAIDEGSDRILEKLLIVHHPDWELFASQKVEIQASLETFVHEHFGQLTTEQLRQIVAWAKENGEENIIDAPSVKEITERAA